MSKCIFYTFAYNAVNTLPRTINSVIKQTCPNWVWYLVDNGSTDDTGRIIREYARRDVRIIPLTNKKNHVWEQGNGWWEIIENHHDNDFLCCLDADDEYKPEFLATMLAFVNANSLEVAACGSDFIDVSTGKIVGKRVLNRELILTGAHFSKYFPRYHQFMRTMWGKLYVISIVKKFNWLNAPALTYGWDTLFATENFRNASRAGILAECLHKYYVSANSLSYQLDEKRIASDRILYETARSFLNDKGGPISLDNEDFLLVIYMNAVRDTLQVLLKTSVSLAEKLAGVIDIFTHKYTGQLMAQSNFGIGTSSITMMSDRRQELFSSMADWLFALGEVPDELVEGYCDAGELLCAAVENAGGWLCFKKLRVQFLLGQNRKDEARDRLAELIELIPNDPEVVSFQQFCSSDDGKEQNIQVAQGFNL